MEALNLKKSDLKKHYMLGIGGIGTGLFLELEGNHTLGREESRSARLLNRRDYCKLHIISHYVQVFLGKNFRAIPIGKVGSDAAGKRLIKEMKDVGMDTRFVEIINDKPTLQSFCYVYPDKSGGNITLLDSACDSLCEEDIISIIPKLKRYSNDAIALVVPEVPLATRQTFLRELSEKMSIFTAASFTAGEIVEAYKSNCFYKVDLLSVNYEEACSLVGLQNTERNYSEEIIKQFLDKVKAHNPLMQVAITAGKHGSWFYDGINLHFEKVFETNVVSTAGAGDAFFAGLIIGWLIGLSSKDMHLFASLMASASVTSEHTIHPTLDRKELLNLLAKHAKDRSDIINIQKLLSR